MATQKEKKFIINYCILKWFNENDTFYLSDVLDEISSSSYMIALSDKINNRSSGICEKLMDVLDNEPSSVIDSMYDFVKLL